MSKVSKHILAQIAALEESERVARAAGIDVTQVPAPGTKRKSEAMAEKSPIAQPTASPSASASMSSSGSPSVRSGALTLGDYEDFGEDFVDEFYEDPLDAAAVHHAEDSDDYRPDKKAPSASKKKKHKAAVRVSSHGEDEAPREVRKRGRPSKKINEEKKEEKQDNICDPISVDVDVIANADDSVSLLSPSLLAHGHAHTRPHHTHNHTMAIPMQMPLPLPLPMPHAPPPALLHHPNLPPLSPPPFPPLLHDKANIQPPIQSNAPLPPPPPPFPALQPPSLTIPILSPPHPLHSPLLVQRSSLHSPPHGPLPLNHSLTLDHIQHTNNI